MAHIDYFCATLSPYVYLAGTRPAEIAAKHGATITYKPVDVVALFGRTGGTAPKDRHPSRQDYRAQELRRWARDLDVPLNLKPAFWPTNGAPAAYALIAAQAAGGGEVVVDVGGLDVEFFGEFVESLKEMFASDEAPTDAMMVVDAFAELIATPKGQRPLRRIVGIDFGVQELNDVTEPVRKAGLEAAGLADWDGAQG